MRYPGLPGDPGHRTAAAQMTSFGAVLALEVADAPTADRLRDHLRVIVHATSLGGVESNRAARHTPRSPKQRGLVATPLGKTPT